MKIIMNSTTSSIRILIFLLFFIFTFVKSSTPNINAQNIHPSCGYQSCNPTKNGMLNVHIVCHTHLDTGWVETYDEYYNRYVRTIYDSVVRTLFEATDRKFIVVETSFFSRWFNEQNDIIRNRVFWLVRTGQLEFISGGWSMNDEAASHYSAIIDNLSLGMRWLNRTFGTCGIPKIGWQIDPFGHSREQASLFSQMAFDGLFLGRIDYQDKILRENTKNMEFVWKSSPSLGSKADIFTSVLPNVYWPPKNFCFDFNCFDELINDNNAHRRAIEFIRLVKKQSEIYRTDHTIITMGMDFYYRDAAKWYTNLDRLMSAVNALQGEERVNMIYSTPSCYLKGVHESNITWSVKTDDFFPYADAYNAYWTGYFTSRPSLKYHIQYANNLLQSAKQLHVIARMSNIFTRKLMPLQETIALLQHHDSVTGTCKQYVNDDYTRMLSKSIGRVQGSITDSYHRLLLNEGFVSSNNQEFCHLLNISQCAMTERIDRGSDVIVTVYNPLAHPVQHFLRLPVRNFRYRVRDASGGIVSTQIVPISDRILSLPSRNSLALSELVFQAILPPLGFTSFTVDKIDPDFLINDNQVSQIMDGSPQATQDVILNNGKISAIFDGQTGLMKGLILKNGKRVPLHQNFFWYQGEDRFRGEKPSGAYAFNPTDHTPEKSTSSVAYKVVRGNLIEEIHQVYKPWITQVIRLYRDYEYIEFDWVIGPIPTNNWVFDHGLEIISRFDTNLQSNATFYTDSNGRESIRRVRHHRPTWLLDTTENVSSNYYPVTSWIFLRDHVQDLQLTLLTDRAQGGSSLKDGSIELMVHRRLLNDDGYGMDEALNEPGEDNNGLVARGKHRLIVNSMIESVRQMRTMSKTLTWKPLPTFKRRILPPHTPLNRQYVPVRTSVEGLHFSGINQLLPKNLHLLTLEPWDDNQILIRLENFYEKNEDPKYSTPTQVSLRNLFTSFRIVNVKEMNLASNREYHSAFSRRFTYNSYSDPYVNLAYDLGNSVDHNSSNIRHNQNFILSGNFTITIKPMEIRTFLAVAEPKGDCPFNGFNIPRRINRRYNYNTTDC